jgi:two-component system, chemotaxis family, chemotaxis protein CheY
MKNCLIVDDSDVVRKVAGHLLTEAGFFVIEAEHGGDALAKCQAGMPDAILVDWQMPIMTGAEFIQSVRLHADGSRPHVVYCTTENDPQAIARALAAGADDYILKPFDRDTLLAKFTHVKSA